MSVPTPERQLENLYRGLPTVNCKKLCFKSCGPVAMSKLEGDIILRRGLANLDHKEGEDYPLVQLKRVKYGLQTGQAIGEGYAFNCDRCPLLNSDGHCSAYRFRPLLCRLWGMMREMRCPFGCEPTRWVSNVEAYSYLMVVEKISRESETGRSLPKR